MNRAPPKMCVACVCEFIYSFPAICSAECAHISAEGGGLRGVEASDLYIRLGLMSLITEYHGERSEVLPC